jgi:hypothetical protein
MPKRRGRPPQHTSNDEKKRARAEKKRIQRQAQSTAQRNIQFDQYYLVQQTHATSLPSVPTPQPHPQISHGLNILAEAAAVAQPQTLESESSDSPILPVEDDDLGKLLPLSPLPSPSLGSLSMDLSDMSEDLPIYIDEAGLADSVEERRVGENKITGTVDMAMTGDMNEDRDGILVDMQIDDNVDGVGKLASRMTDQLIQYQGCCSHCHRRYQDEHAERYQSHYGLQEYLDKTRDSVNYPDILGCETIATREQDLAGRSSASVKRQIYCGSTGENAASTPVHICLEADDRRTTTAEVAFDIDSIIGFPASLAIAKQGIRWHPTQMPVSDLRSGLHLKTRHVHYIDCHGHAHKVRKRIHQLPHYVFGRLVGFEDISLYLLFPRLYREDQQSSRLLDHDFSVWMDQVLLPAIYQHYSSSQVQHYPSSYDHSRYNATARGVEARSQRSDTMAREQQLIQFLPPDSLHLVWQTILDTIQRPGLQQFRDVTIFFQVKNLKTLTKDATWEAMMTRFQKYWTGAIDEAHITSEFYFDVGKEVCPGQRSRVNRTKDEEDEPAETLMWRRCCLETYGDRIQGQYTGAADTPRRMFYPFSMLYDSGSMTIETGQMSKARAEGLLYSQFYPSIKGVFAAGNQYPFTNTAIESLALDPNLRRTWQHVGGALSHDPVALIRAYQYTKLRCHHATQGSMEKSFGIREEHRMSKELFNRIDAEFRRRNIHTRHFRPATGGNRPYHTYATATVMRWLRWNINKFCVGFEMVYSLTEQRFITWEHTRIMLMFLRCLRLSYSGGLVQRISGCWQDVCYQTDVKQADRQRRVEGLGFCKTMEQYGYAWFLDKVDWETMTFRLPHRPYMQFNSPSMLAHYHTHYRTLRDVQADFITVEDYFGLMRKYSLDRARSYAILSLLADVCLRVFRKDVFQHIRSTIRSQYRASALSGEVALCGPTLEKIIKKDHLPLHFVSGNRMIAKHVETLFEWLWDWRGEGFSRQHWIDKPYRMLYRRCDEMIGRIYGQAQAESWTVNLKQRFIQTHWVLPYPQSSSFFSRTKKQQHCWWSSYHSGLADHHKLSSAVRPGLVSTKALLELPINGWQFALQAMQLETKLPWIPENLEQFLQRLPAIEAGDVLAFPASEPVAQSYQLRSLLHRRKEGQFHGNKQWLNEYLPIFLHAQETAAEKELLDTKVRPRTRPWQHIRMDQTGCVEGVRVVEDLTDKAINPQPVQAKNENVWPVQQELKRYGRARCRHELSLCPSTSDSEIERLPHARSLIQRALRTEFNLELPSLEAVERWRKRIHPDSQQIMTVSRKKKNAKGGRPRIYHTEEEASIRKRASSREYYQRRKQTQQILKQGGLQVRFHALSVLAASESNRWVAPRTIAQRC